MNTHAGTTHNAAAQPAPLERMGRYRLLGRLGQGGMGTIHLGVSVGLADFRKLLVVKELRPELTSNEHFVQMFLAEAKLAARLQHPNIVQTLEAGQDGERFFLAMEFLDGQPLSELLKRAMSEPVVSLPMRMHVLCEVLSGLQYAHELCEFDDTPLQIVHRDVNPQNVFITYHGHVKLLDFGIAKVVDSELCTTAGVFKGKFPYAAPEQVDCRKVDRRADVFAVGVMLWEIIAQRRFAPGQPTMQGIDARLAGTEPRIAEALPGVAPELAAICDRAMHVDPEQRYASAEAFRADLHAYLVARNELCTAAEVGEVLRKKFEQERAVVHRLITTHVRQLAPDEELGDSLVRALTRGAGSKSGLTPVEDPVTGSSTGSSRTSRERPSVTRQRDLRDPPTPTPQRLFSLRRRRQARTRRVAGLAGAALLAFGAAYLWVSRQTAAPAPHALAGTSQPQPPAAAEPPAVSPPAPPPPVVEMARVAPQDTASGAPSGSKSPAPHPVRRAGPTPPALKPEPSAQSRPQAAGPVISSSSAAREARPGRGAGERARPRPTDRRRHARRAPCAPDPGANPRGSVLMTQLSPLRFLLAPAALLLVAAGVHAQADDSLADIAELAPDQAAPAASSSKSAPAAEGGGETLPSARAHFERGVELYADGDYRAALVELTRAYGLQPTYKMLYNLGQVTFELRDYAGAERYYRAYLSEGADEIPAERRDQVRQELSRLQSRVASLRIRINLPGASVRVDDVLVSHPEHPVRVSAGQRKLVAERSGYAPVQRMIEVAGGEELEVSLDFGLPLTAATSAPAASGGSAAPLILAISAGVLTAAGVGAGYWAYVDTNARNDRLNEFTTRAELDRLSSQAHSKALLADVLFGTAAAAAAVGLVMYLAQPSVETPPAARASRRPLRASF